jgi:hypothetical protein
MVCATPEGVADRNEAVTKLSSVDGTDKFDVRSHLIDTLLTDATEDGGALWNSFRIVQRHRGAS